MLFSYTSHTAPRRVVSHTMRYSTLGERLQDNQFHFFIWKIAIERNIPIINETMYCNNSN